MLTVLNITINDYIICLESFFSLPKGIVHFDFGLASIFWFLLFSNNGNDYNGLFTVNP